jgi:hypothetical protein
MHEFRIFPLSALAVAALILGGCATSAPEQYASRECKIVPADFVDHPKKSPTPVEQAEAQLRMQRYAYSRGGYAIGNNMPMDAVRDCY